MSGGSTEAFATSVSQKERLMELKNQVLINDRLFTQNLSCIPPFSWLKGLIWQKRSQEPEQSEASQERHLKGGFIYFSG